MWAKGRYLLLALLLLSAVAPVAAPAPVVEWGFHGHREINGLAIYTLPEGMFGYFKAHADFIRVHAVDPDKRRYSMKGEAERHYIDIDHYCHQTDTAACNPFGFVPRRWNDAVEKLSEDTLRAYGIVPWHVNKMVYRLADAFRDRNHTRILRTAAELGHYVGDAHVPLHTTENYNGQLTGQKGIHGFWESRLPELYDGNYDLLTGQATYIERPLDFIWDRVEESHAAVDSVLRFERELNAEWPEDQKYAYEERGVTLVRTYSEGYSKEYHRRLDGQVERRMKQAVRSLGSLWYTAWVNAGQPDLTGLGTEAETDALRETLEKEREAAPVPDLQKRQHDG